MHAKAVLHWPGMLVLIASASIIKITLMPAFSLMPLLVKNHFNGGPPELGLFEALAGVGMLLGGLIISALGGFKRKVHTVLFGLLGIGASSLVLGLTPENMFWLALVSIFVVGLTISIIDAPIAAIMQSTVPPEMQGRVFGLLGSLFSLTTPIGLGIVIMVGDGVSIPFWFQLAGVIAIAVAAVSFFIPAFMHLEEHKFNGTSTATESDTLLVETSASD